MADNPWLVSLVEAFEGDKSALPEHEEDPFPDELDSPGLSEFVRLGRRYLVGVVSDHEFVDGIQSTLIHLREAMMEHRAQVALLALTPEQVQLSEQADRAYLQFSEGLSEMVTSFTERDLPRVERGLELCKQAAQVLEKWNAELIRLERRENAIICSSCGRVNGSLSPICSECQQPLPAQDEEYDPELDFVHAPERYVRFFDATAAVATGAVAVAPWASALEQFRLDVEDAYALVREIGGMDPRMIELLPDIKEECEELAGALKITLNTVTKLQDYPNTHDPRLLDESWFKMLWQVPGMHQNTHQLRLSLEALLEHLSSEDFVAFDEGDGEYDLEE